MNIGDMVKAPIDKVAGPSIQHMATIREMRQAGASHVEGKLVEIETITNAQRGTFDRGTILWWGHDGPFASRRYAVAALSDIEMMGEN